MAVCATLEAIIAKIVSQNCRRREDKDNESSLFFAVTYRDKDWTFSIPQPLEGEGYTLSQLNEIEVQLARLGLDLLPLDPYIH